MMLPIWLIAALGILGLLGFVAVLLFLAIMAEGIILSRGPE